MEKSEDVGFFGGILIFIGFVLIFPLLIILLACFLVSQFTIRVKNKIELEKILKENDEEIILLYNNYNQINFSEVLKRSSIDIKCLLVDESNYNDVFLSHLCKGFNTKAYPRLVKIERKKVIKKEHYNSFKYYVKRNNDMDSFLRLLKRSINNMKNEKSRTIT